MPDSSRLPHARRRSAVVGALAATIFASLVGNAAASNHIVTGPSSSQSPYVLPSAEGVRTVSILTVGDSVGGYRMVGVPDGLGALDNGGTFTLLVNHELGFNQGVVRRHGQAGAFVSRWTIQANPETPAVLAGQDLIKRVTTTSSRPPTLDPAVLIRFCSADLPPKTAFYNPATHLGWNGVRIYMNGEETSPGFPPSVHGRAFAHLLNGKSYELPRFGQISWENLLANPASGDNTVVVGTDDTSAPLPLGQVYIYIGTKTKSGGPIDRAGLTNGSLLGVKVSELVDEHATNPDPLGLDDTSTFTLHNFGNVEGWGGDALQANSEANAVTEFRRPEDGAWDPNHPNDFYFVTTNAFSNPSRLWRLRFTDLANPAAGGTIELLVEGAEGGHQMFDNITIDRHGHVLIQEDPGVPREPNPPGYIARIWQYDIATDTLTEIAHHDPARFTTAGTMFLTQDEESSGIIDASEILGDGWFLLDVQAHYAIAGELVEGGQLLALYNPDSDPAAP